MRRFFLVVAILLVAPAGAQRSAPETSAVGEPARPVEGGAAVYEDGISAYEAGAYDEALRHFSELRVVRPESAALTMNLGSAHYQKGDYEAAGREFGSVASGAVQGLGAQALYNLGNVAFRQDQLEQAIALYKAALEIDPDDMDAKFNLEYARQELRRRQEQQQQEPEDQQGEQGQSGDEEEQQSSDGEDGSGEEPQGEGEEQESPSSTADGDGDGVPDQTETGGENPTDPHDPDTDGDGLSDGEEDRNANGRRDPDETDPNLADTDGDGIGDAEEASQEARSQPGAAGELSEEEAERYLQALEEGRPADRRAAGRVRRMEKDW